MAPPFDWFQWASESHAELTKDWMTSTITIECPGVGQVDVQAVLGSPGDVSEVEIEAGAAMETKFRDFIVTRTDVVINAAVYLPNAGDLVHYTNPGGQVLTYELRNYITAPAVEDHDRFGYKLRLHGELLEIADA